MGYRSRLDAALESGIQAAMASLVKRRDHYYAQFFDTDRYPKRKDVARRQLTTWEEVISAWISR